MNAVIVADTAKRIGKLSPYKSAQNIGPPVELPSAKAPELKKIVQLVPGQSTVFLTRGHTNRRKL